MKKSIFILGILALAFAFYSCEKEVIEVVNQQEINDELIMKKGSNNTGPKTDLDIVTDPNEDEDFDKDKKNSLSTAK